MNSLFFRRFVARVLVVCMTITQASQVVALTLANTPLAATTTSTVRPNIMYVLDDSGSMAWEFTPDYINDATVTQDPGSLGGSVADGVLANVAVKPGPVTSLVSSNGSWDKVYSLGTPSVVIVGGGGTGASATVTLNATTKKISSINLVSGGTGYTSNPYVTLVGGIGSATWGMCWGTTGASNQGGTPKDTTVSPTCSNDTQPPYAAGAVNYQYYDPTVRYEAPMRANGTRYSNADPTNAWRDGFSGATASCTGGTGTCNLNTGWTHEVWCSVATPSPTPTAANIATHTQCKENSDTSGDNLYPNATYTFRKTYNGAASYYTMGAPEYCTDTTLSNCVRATAPQVISGTTFNVPAYYRWCSYYNPLSHSYGGCQARRDWSHYIPNYLGGWVSTGAAGVQATAGLTVTTPTPPATLNGQSIIGVTINGADVVGGATFTGTAASTPATIATSVCNAIQANIGSSGYGCSMVGTTAQIIAAAVGTAANGLEVVAAGPAGPAAAYSTGELRVLSISPTQSYTITGITITRSNSTVVNLISATVPESGTIGATAKAICEAIKAGPATGTYTVRSGEEAEATAGTLAWGTCNTSSTGWVGIKKLIADTDDNGALLKVLGPATATVYSGQITVNNQGGAARLDDVKIGATSVLTNSPRQYADTVTTSAIASDIATNISATGCTASAVSNVVTFTGTSNLCGAASALSVTGSSAQATATIRVSPSTSVYSGSLAGIDVGLPPSATTILGALTSTQITDTTNALTNANTIVSRINASTSATANGLGPTSFSALAPSAAGGGAYDVTVKAPAGNTYNGKSFVFKPGTPAAAIAGTQPSWTFDITGATTDNKKISSITCGATQTITQNTASTGNAGATDYIANLSTGATTNGLNGRSYNNYSFTCNSSGSCTLTGPAGAAACTTPTVSSDASISFANWVRTNAGSNGTPTWRFNITGATTDNKRINSIQCNGVDVVSPNTVVTGTGATSATMVTSLATTSSGALNTKNPGLNGYSYSCNASGNCTLTGPSGTVGNCDATTLQTGITKDSKITLNTFAYTAGVGGTQPTWLFDITGATTDSATVGAITCNGSQISNQGNSGRYDCDRINNLISSTGGLQDAAKRANGYSFSCGACSSSSSTCTVTGPTGSTSGQSFCSGNLSISADASITVPSSVAKSVTGVAATTGTAASYPVTVTVSGNGTDSKTIDTLNCGSTLTFATKPNTGTATYYATALANSLNGMKDNTKWVSGSSSCTANDAANTVTCSIRKNATACAATPVIVLSPSSGSSALTVTTPPNTPAANGTMTFTLGNVSTTNQTITGIHCQEGSVTTDNASTSYSISTSGSDGGSQATTAFVKALLGCTTTSPCNGNGGGSSTTHLNTNYWRISSSSCTLSGTGSNMQADCVLVPETSSGSGNNPACFNSQPSITGNGVTISALSGGGNGWNVTFSNIHTDATLNAITCKAGGTTANAITGTATTGSTTLNTLAVQHLNNLKTNLNNSTVVASSGYQFTGCTVNTGTPNMTCTLSGPIPSGATPPSCTMASDASITATVGTATAGTGPTSGTAPQWQFNITGATTDSKSITGISCAGGASALTGSVSTGTPTTQYIQNIVNGLGGNYTATGGTYNTSCTTSGMTSPQQRCTVTGPVGAAACTNLAIPTAGGVSLSTASPGTTSPGSGGTSPRWTFNIASVDASTASADNATISGITCGGTATFSGTAPNTGTYEWVRINSLSSFLAANGANNYSVSCTPAATSASSQTTCTITGQANTSPACTSMVLSPDTTITADQPALVSGTGATRPTWTFDISNATTAARTIDSITCGGTDTFLTTAKPNTGNSTLADWQRVNNLTQSGGLSSLGANGYSYSCPSATATSSPITTCTVQGPAGVAACTNLVITPEASSGITTNNMARNNAGGAAVAAQENFAPYLSQVQGFSGGYSGLSSTLSGLNSVKQGTIPTDSPSATPHIMSNANPVSAQTIVTNATGTAPNVLTMAGGLAADTSTNNWNGVGIFKRYDIVSGGTYSRGPSRSDCAGSTCTGAEELQNFANWYSYYRVRMTMMKSATTLAFNQLDDKYRIGFDNICGADTGTETTVVRGVAQFSDTAEVTNQRTNWWSSLTASNPSCATPLRAETAKIGRYFAGKLTGSADPIQYSCQQNFMLLVTDGYWNENETTAIKKIDGTDIGNQDNNSATAARPFYDGAQASTTCPTVGSARGSNNSSCRTLADITWYYYSTDLRDASLGNSTITLPDGSSRDVSKNNVATSADDKNQAQHMNFYAMGLGIDGTLEYRSDYQTAASGDFYDIKQGTRNWPAVANLDPTAVDDLWHATVNGHGKYFSARNLPNVVAGLREALNKIGARVGSAAAAATSNLEPVAGDNFAYVASYTTVDWVGDLQSRSIDVLTGDVSSDTNCDVAGSGCQWSAQQKLDNMTWSTRRLYLQPNSGATGDPPRAFTYNNLNPTEAAYFNPSSLSQYSVPADANMTATKLVDFLRGDRSLEQDGDNSHAQLWRKRTHVLGDIVNTQPVFMKKPSGSYLDDGYSDFKTTGTAATRNPVVFVSAQDGMLHAFNAHSAAVTVSGVAVQPGEEMWSYIPQQALANMKKLADVNYGGQTGSNAHRYFIDGQITIADVNFGAAANDWHTILIAGLGAGGTSYFALDVTDPVNPLYLWEFTHLDLGYSFANPIVSKLPDGTWAVFFTSGYNNTDGKGYLFAINPKTGAVKSGYPITNGSGSAGVPSNLGKLAIWATDPALNNSAQYAYAGDLNGDLWRFDINPTASGHTGSSVFKLAHFANGATAQPITTKPELTSFSDGTRLVYVGTGKYLESADLTNTDVQTFYAVKDTLGAANMGGGSQVTWHPTTDTTTVSGSTVPMFLQRKLIGTDSNGSVITQTVNGVTRAYRKVCRGGSSTITAGTLACANEDTTAMDWSVYGGWYATLPDSGERLNVDTKLVRGTLVFASNIPAADSCTVGGSAWLNVLDYNTGLAVAGVSTTSTKIADSLVVGVTVVRLASGEYKAIATKSNYQQETFQVPVATTPTPGSGTSTSSAFGAKRSLWREFEAY